MGNKKSGKQQGSVLRVRQMSGEWEPLASAHLELSTPPNKSGTWRKHLKGSRWSLTVIVKRWYSLKN